MGTQRKKNHRKKKKQGRTAAPYPFDLRLKVVKLYLEDRYPPGLQEYLPGFKPGAKSHQYQDLPDGIQVRFFIPPPLLT